MQNERKLDFCLLALSMLAELKQNSSLNFEMFLSKFSARIRFDGSFHLGFRAG
jgi:hypothetical protein